MANIVPSGRLLRSLRSSIRHDALLQGQCRSLYAQRCASDRFSATPSRSFSTTPACTAAKKEDPLLKQMSAAQPKQKAMSLVKEQAMSRMEIPDDVGLLPATFVSPTWSNRPKNLATRGRWEWRRLKAKMRDVMSFVIVKFYFVRPKSKEDMKALSWSQWLKYRFFVHNDYQLFELPSIAKRLYQEMYERFADGTIDRMQPRMAESIYASLSSKVARRSPNSRVQWKLHKYVGYPWLVSYRQTVLSTTEPQHMRSTIQQAVVRIKSMQSLKKYKKVRQKSGATVEELEEGSTPDAKPVMEYFVIQKMTKKGYPGPWKVWGTTTETTWDVIKEEDRREIEG